jgi:carbon-monoxide dehydrogenase large subunit
MESTSSAGPGCAIGRPHPRQEDPRLLTGGGSYGSDLRLPDMVELAFVRSPHAHARIEAIHTQRAQARPGVIGVYTAANLDEVMQPAPGMIWTQDARVAAPTPLATDIVRYVGEPVAVVVAADRYTAEDGVAAVAVRYTLLPPVMSVEQDPATTPILHAGWDSNLAERFEVTVGEGARALERAPFVVDATLVVDRVSAQPLEPRAVMAVYDAREQFLTVHLATQAAHTRRREFGDALGLPIERIRVVTPEIGGAFGVKNRLYGEDVLAAHLAIKLGRAVKWVGDRHEEFISTNQGRAQVHHVRLGLDADARILALVDHFSQDAGAYNINAGVAPRNTVMTLQGPYRIPNAAYTCDVVLTTAPPTGPYRGAGRPEAAYVMERILDRAAQAVGIDRMELRRRNLIQPDELPYDTGVPSIRSGGVAFSAAAAPPRSTITYEDGDFPAGFERLLEAVGYVSFGARREAARARGIYLGIGVANAVEMAGIGAGEQARLRLDADRTLTVAVGVAILGQGLATAFAQIAADRLGVPLERVRVVAGDTAALAEGIGAFGSRSTVSAGNAVSAAATRLRERILHAAAEHLEAAVADLVWDGTHLWVQGAPQRRVPVRELVQAEADTGDEGLEEEAGAPGPRTFGYQGHGVVVAVDPGTLVVRVEDYVICHDAGTIVNPLLADGQTIGSAVQGLGMALSEAMRYDDEGRPLTTSFYTYVLPSATDTPDYRLIEQHYPPSSNLEGFKGLAEGGTITALPAIAQAIEDALAPFGVRLDAVPITPQRLHDSLAGRTVQTEREAPHEASGI